MILNLIALFIIGILIVSIAAFKSKKELLIEIVSMSMFLSTIWAVCRLYDWFKVTV